MKRVIYEFNYTEEKEFSEEVKIDDDIIYYRVYINPHNFLGMCGRRCDTIYCDARFMDSYSGRVFITEVLRPMLCLKNPDGEGFRLFNPNKEGFRFFKPKEIN